MASQTDTVLNPDQANRVQRVSNAYRIAIQRLAPTRTREALVWKMYDGTEFGQWDINSVQALVQQGRPVTTYNVIKPKIDTILGSLIANPFEVHYESALGQPAADGLIYRLLYEKDWEEGRFDDQFKEVIRAGLIHRGVLELYVDYERDPRGVIGARAHHPLRFLFDPDWQTRNINDNKRIFSTVWMTADEIKRVYHTKSERVDAAIATYEAQQGSPQSYNEQDKIADRAPDWYWEQCGRYLVVQEYTLKYRNTTQLFDETIGEFLPATDENQLDLIVSALKKAGHTITPLKRMVRQCWVRTVAPALSLDLLLEDNLTDLQIGRYPFFTFESDNIGGHVSSYVDQMKSAQEEINKRASVATHILMTSANNGLLVESDTFEGQGELDKFKRDHHKPGYVGVVPSGSNAQEKIKPIPRSDPPDKFWELVDRSLNIINLLSPAVPALTGQDEDKDQSGILYNSKRAQAAVVMGLIEANVRDLYDQFGKAYARAVRQVYADSIRILRDPEQNRTLILNLEGENDIANLTEPVVRVIQSGDGENVRRERLQLIANLKQAINDPVMNACLNKLMVDAIPDISEDDRDQMRKAADLSLQLAVEAAKGQLAGWKSQEQQAQGQAAQAAAPNGQAPGLPNAPQPGAAPQGPGQNMGAALAGALASPQPQP